MKFWESRAITLLKKSLQPIPTELNELDWKSDISDNTVKWSRHLSAFSHLPDGGFLVFGLNNNGTFCQIEKDKIDNIIRHLEKEVQYFRSKLPNGIKNNS